MEQFFTSTSGRVFLLLQRKQSQVKRRGADLKYRGDGSNIVLLDFSGSIQGYYHGRKVRYL
jgi:hypothetical protein